MRDPKHQPVIEGGVDPEIPRGRLAARDRLVLGAE